jgi:hypothetical protein
MFFWSAGSQLGLWNQPEMFPRSSIIDLGMSQHHIYLKVKHGCLFE